MVNLWGEYEPNQSPLTQKYPWILRVPAYIKLKNIFFSFIFKICVLAQCIPYKMRNRISKKTERCKKKSRPILFSLPLVQSPKLQPSHFNFLKLHFNNEAYWKSCISELKTPMNFFESESGTLDSNLPTLQIKQTDPSMHLSLSHKQPDLITSFFGTQMKMIFRLSRAHKIWCKIWISRLKNHHRLLRLVSYKNWAILSH